MIRKNMLFMFDNFKNNLSLIALMKTFLTKFIILYLFLKE